MLLLHANYDGFFYSRGLGAWLRTTRNGRFYGHNLQFTGGVNFVRGKLQTTTSYKNWGKYKTGNMGLDFYLYSVELLVCILMDYVGLLASKK